MSVFFLSNLVVFSLAIEFRISTFFVVFLGEVSSPTTGAMDDFCFLFFLLFGSTGGGSNLFSGLEFLVRSLSFLLFIEGSGEANL